MDELGASFQLLLPHVNSLLVEVLKLINYFGKIDIFSSMHVKGIHLYVVVSLVLQIHRNKLYFFHYLVLYVNS